MAIAFVRFWARLLAGALLGAGLVLHGQVAFANYMRAEVADVFFLWRGVGQITFVFQDDRTKLGLWLNEIPQRVLVESARAAWTLIVVGGVLAMLSLAMRPHRARQR
jgi:hypothetical protein